MASPAIRPQVVALWLDTAFPNVEDPTTWTRKDGTAFTSDEFALLLNATQAEIDAGLAQLQREAEYHEEKAQDGDRLLSLLAPVVAQLDTDGSIADLAALIDEDTLMALSGFVESLAPEALARLVGTAAESSDLKTPHLPATDHAAPPVSGPTSATTQSPTPKDHSMTVDPTPEADTDSTPSPKAPGDASPVRTGETGFWMTDRDLRARLRSAVEDLLAIACWAIQDDHTLIDVLENWAPGVCEQTDLDPAYVPLVQAHTAHVAATWTISPTCSGPLDIGLLLALDEFHTLRPKVQAALLNRYEAEEADWEEYGPSGGRNPYQDLYDETAES